MKNDGKCETYKRRIDETFMSIKERTTDNRFALRPEPKLCANTLESSNVCFLNLSNGNKNATKDYRLGQVWR